MGERESLADQAADSRTLGGQDSREAEALQLLEESYPGAAPSGLEARSVSAEKRLRRCEIQIFHGAGRIGELGIPANESFCARSAPTSGSRPVLKRNVFWQPQSPFDSILRGFQDLTQTVRTRFTFVIQPATLSSWQHLTCGHLGNRKQNRHRPSLVNRTSTCCHISSRGFQDLYHTEISLAGR